MHTHIEHVKHGDISVQIVRQIDVTILQQALRDAEILRLVAVHHHHLADIERVATVHGEGYGKQHCGGASPDRHRSIASPEKRYQCEGNAGVR